jgi:hypothetical protein
MNIPQRSSSRRKANAGFRHLPGRVTGLEMFQVAEADKDPVPISSSEVSQA